MRPNTSSPLPFAMLGLITSCALGCGFLGGSDDTEPPETPASNSTPSANAANANASANASTPANTTPTGNSTPVANATSNAQSNQTPGVTPMLSRPECGEDAREDRCDQTHDQVAQWGQMLALESQVLLGIEPECCADYNDDGIEDNNYGVLIDAIGSLLGLTSEFYAERLDQDLELALQPIYEVRPDQDSFWLTSHVGLEGEQGAPWSLQGEQAFQFGNTATATLDGQGGFVIDGGVMLLRARLLQVPFVIPVQGVAAEGTLTRDEATGLITSVQMTVSGYMLIEDLVATFNAFIDERCGCVDGLPSPAVVIDVGGQGRLEEVRANFDADAVDASACQPDPDTDLSCGQIVRNLSSIAPLITSVTDVDSRAPGTDCFEEDTCDSMSMTHTLGASAVTVEQAVGQ